MNRVDLRLLAGITLTSLLSLSAHTQEPGAALVEKASAPASEPAPLTTATAIHPAQFEALFASIKPTKTELKWLEIPWLGKILEGRQAARAAEKPMFLWAMNGHPLGTC